MADIPEYDPTKDDTGAAGGASGGGDDDAQDWNLLGGPTDSPEEQRRRWYQRGAMPKDPYRYERLPHDDEDIPMSELPKEKSGLPKQKGDAETSFTEGGSMSSSSFVNVVLTSPYTQKISFSATAAIIFPNSLEYFAKPRSIIFFCFGLSFCLLYR